MLQCLQDEREKLEKALLKEKAKIVMKRSVAGLEKTLNRLKTEKRLLVKTNKKLVLSSLQRVTSGDRITYRLLKNIPPMYFGSVFRVAKTVLSYYNKEVLELLPFISERR